MTIKPRHDEMFRSAMSYPEVAREFFDAHLPQNIKAIVDLQTLSLEKGDFIDAELKDSITDLLFKVNFEGNQGYIYLLLEHQSRSDKWMALRMHSYMLDICKQHIANNPKTSQLPVIYPIIFYNGGQKYKASQNFWDLFSGSEMMRDLWNKDHLLINIQDIPDEEIKSRSKLGITEFFMKHIHERNMLELWEELRNSDVIVDVLEWGCDNGYLRAVMSYSLTKVHGDDKMGDEIKRLLLDVAKNRNMEESAMNLLEYWEHKGKMEGKMEGKLEGIVEGKVEGKMEERLHIAQELLKLHTDPVIVSKATGLKFSELQELQSSQ